MKKRTNKIINIILYTILAIVLLVNLFILYQAKVNDDEVPAIFGYKPFIVMSGSMETEIYINDLVFVKTTDTDKLTKDDIIAFRTADNVVVTHRIVEVKEEKNGDRYFVTKGDNNQTQDSDLVREKDVEGKYVSRIPKIGSWFLFISKPVGMIVSILIAIIIIFIYAFINMEKDKKEESKEDEELRKEFEEFKKQKAKNK